MNSIDNQTISKYAGMALILSAVLNMTRVVPMFMSDGVSMENFPPHSVGDLVFYTGLYGWFVSHIMGIISVPAMVFGLIVFWRRAAHSGWSLAALVGYSIGMGLYLFGLISDGLLLPRLISSWSSELASGDTTAESFVYLTHSFATTFAGFSAVVMLTSTAFLGLSVLKDFNRSLLGYFGIAVGIVSSIGFITGFLNLIITDGIGRVGPLTLLMFMYIIVIGLLLKHSENNV
ncbi:MAG: hypothetical protein AAF542_16970 [Pseudomonadota bacterium]